MPTMVERLLAELIDASVKLDGIDGRATQVQFIGSADKINGDFLELSTTTSADSFHAFELRAAPQFAAIGGDFSAIGGDFNRIANLGLVADALFPAASRDSTVQADFLMLDASVKADSVDLGSFGQGFMALDHSANSAGFRAAVAVLCDGSVSKLSTDMGGSASAFGKLGADLVALGGSVDLNKSPLDVAYRTLGATLEGIGAEFTTLSADFRGLGGDMHAFGQKTSSVTASANLGADFLQLDHAFLALDSGLSKIGAPLATILVTELGLSPST